MFGTPDGNYAQSLVESSDLTVSDAKLIALCNKN
jgi:hypothetical protein